jgi:protein-S-isoprenylcysteine O-methyltransferase Ste14
MDHTNQKKLNPARLDAIILSHKHLDHSVDINIMIEAMTESGELDSSGILGIMRHPWYLAVFILIWAHDFNLAGMIINLVLSAYLLVGTLLEERKLVLEFGEPYKLYQRQVSMFSRSNG